MSFSHAKRMVLDTVQRFASAIRSILASTSGGTLPATSTINVVSDLAGRPTGLFAFVDFVPRIRQRIVNIVNFVKAGLILGEERFTR